MQVGPPYKVDHDVLVGAEPIWRTKERTTSEKVPVELNGLVGVSSWSRGALTVGPGPRAEGTGGRPGGSAAASASLTLT